MSADEHLELRIHGVNNTSPAAMLDLYPVQVEQFAGDRLGGFWQARHGVLAGLAPTDRGWTPADVRREAYSWGGLARTSPDGWFGGAAKTISAGLGRLAWVLLIPFGITNIAYWTRRLPDPSGTTQRRGDAWAARLFALVLTALLVVTLSDLSMDVLARQCYGRGVVLCTNLPFVFDTAASWTPDQRLAAAALLPVAALAFLWLVIGRSGSRYEAVPVAGGGSQTFLFGLQRFWAGRRMLSGLLLAHLTVGLGIVTLLSSWAALLGDSAGCRTWTDLRACVTTLHDRPTAVALFGWAAAASVLLLVAAVLVLVWRSVDAADLGPATGTTGRLAPRLSVGLFVVAAGLLGVVLGALCLAGPTGPQACAFGGGHGPGLAPCGPVPGFLTTPTVLTAVALGLGVSSVAWRWALVPGTSWARSLVPTVGLLVGPLLLVRSAWAGVASAAVAVGVGAVAMYAGGGGANGGGDDRGRAAWRGGGPAVFQLLALVCALALSSLVVLAAADWLNGGNTPASLVRDGVALRTGEPVLRVPPVYGWFALALVVALLALAVVCVLVAAVGVWFQGPPGPAPGTPEPPAAAALASRRRSARRIASFTQRAEPLVGVAGLLAAVCTGWALAAAAGEWAGGAAGGTWEDGSVALVAMAGSTVAIVLLAGSSVGSARPLGLLWDLICVVPRAAHPLGPPCYAERAVPEISRRVDAWLDGPGSTESRRVVLSAHSLGSVLAAAVVMGRRTSDSRVRLLTYGSQLRGYFGRLFPELLGHGPLGVPGCPSPSALRADPWARQQPAVPLGPAEASDAASPDSLYGRLLTAGEEVHWYSLWRRTDYIGFPVYSYDASHRNPVDRVAQEHDDSNYSLAVVSHSDYPRSSAYARALALLLRR